MSGCGVEAIDEVMLTIAPVEVEIGEITVWSAGELIRIEGFPAEVEAVVMPPAGNAYVVLSSA